jgi:hypothetical protein
VTEASPVVQEGVAVACACEPGVLDGAGTA